MHLNLLILWDLEINKLVLLLLIWEEVQGLVLGQDLVLVLALTQDREQGQAFLHFHFRNLLQM